MGSRSSSASAFVVLHSWGSRGRRSSGRALVSVVHKSSHVVAALTLVLQENSASIACCCRRFRRCPASRRLPNPSFGWGLRCLSSPPRRQLALAERCLWALQALHGAGRTAAWRVQDVLGHGGSGLALPRCGFGRHRSAAFGWRFASHTTELGRISDSALSSRGRPRRGRSLFGGAPGVLQHAGPRGVRLWARRRSVAGRTARLALLGRCVGPSSWR